MSTNSKKISKSPHRHSFQKDSYIERQIEKDESINADILKIYDESILRDLEKEADPNWANNNLEYDLRTTPWILQKARLSESYSQNLYAALCNREFIKLDVIPILTDHRWSCTWRYAGGIIANMREEGDYIDWYCSGIQNDVSEEDVAKFTPEQMTRYQEIQHYVPEGIVTEEIRADLQKLGWVVANRN